MKVHEFRKDLSKHLTAALNGETIYIERAGVIFELKAKAMKPLSRPIGTADKELHVPVESYHRITTKTEDAVEFCTHNQVKGLCKKGCR